MTPPIKIMNGLMAGQTEQGNNNIPKLSLKSACIINKETKTQRYMNMHHLLWFNYILVRCTYSEGFYMSGGPGVRIDSFC